MKKSILFCFVSLCITLQAQEEILAALQDLAIIDQKVMMPMRDGIEFSNGYLSS